MTDGAGADAGRGGRAGRETRRGRVEHDAREAAEAVRQTAPTRAAEHGDRGTNRGKNSTRTVAATSRSSVTAPVEKSKDQEQRIPRDEEAVRRYVEQIAMRFADWGFPRMAGRVLFALMTADEPGLTAVELGRRLDASAAAISGAVRYLGQLHLVVREPVPGSRSDLHRLADNAWYAAAVTELGLYQSIADSTETVLDALGAGSPAHARVAEMREFFLFFQVEMAALLAKWQSVRAAQ